MRIGCPHCSKELKLSDAAVASLQKLPAGKVLKVKCVHCGQGFPFDGGQRAAKAVKAANSAGAVSAGENGGETAVRPPVPPDISWLSQDELTVKQKMGGVPLALLLMPEEELKDIFFREINALDYHVEVAATVDEALTKIMHGHYELVVCYSGHDKEGFLSSELHRYLCCLPMGRRRRVFYVLVGSEFKTLYQLQALSYSANLVVNDNEVKYIGNFLQKAMADHQQFLEPLLSELDLVER